MSGFVLKCAGPARRCTFGKGHTVAHTASLRLRSVQAWKTAAPHAATYSTGSWHRVAATGGDGFTLPPVSSTSDVDDINAEFDHVFGGVVGARRRAVAAAPTPAAPAVAAVAAGAASQLDALNAEFAQVFGGLDDPVASVPEVDPTEAGDAFLQQQMALQQHRDVDDGPIPAPAVDASHAALEAAAESRVRQQQGDVHVHVHHHHHHHHHK